MNYTPTTDKRQIYKMFCSIVLFRKQIVFFVNKSFFCSS